MNETWVTMVGTLITDVRCKQTGAGLDVANFRMVSNERRFNKATGEWIDGDRFYVAVACWRRLAANVAVSLNKGDPVIVRGRLYSREYEQDGQKRSMPELEATSIGPDLNRCSVQMLRAHRSRPGAIVGTSVGEGELDRIVPRQSVRSKLEVLNESARPALQPTGGTLD